MLERRFAMVVRLIYNASLTKNQTRQKRQTAYAYVNINRFLKQHFNQPCYG